MAEPINGAEPVSDEIHDIEAYTPMSGRVLGEDGKMYNLVGLLQNAGFNGGSNGGTIFKSVAAYDDLPPPAGEHRDELYFVQTSTGGLFGFIGAYKYPRGFYAVNAEDIWEQVPISVSVSDNAFTIVNITDWAAFRDFTGTVNEKDVVLYGGVLYQNLTGGVTSDPPPDDVDNWVILPQCAGFIDEEALSQYVAEHALLKDEQAADSAMLGGRSPDYYAKATRQIGMGSRESILELFDEFGEGTYMLVAPYTDVGDLPEAISPAATANLILDIKKEYINGAMMLYHRAGNLCFTRAISGGAWMNEWAALATRDWITANAVTKLQVTAMTQTTLLAQLYEAIGAQSHRTFEVMFTPANAANVLTDVPAGFTGAFTAEVLIYLSGARVTIKRSGGHETYTRGVNNWNTAPVWSTEWAANFNLGYQTAETLTGKTWVDGKPIYRRLITGSLASSQNGQWVNAGAAVTGIGTIIPGSLQASLTGYYFNSIPSGFCDFDANNDLVRSFHVRDFRGSYQTMQIRIKHIDPSGMADKITSTDTYGYLVVVEYTKSG